MNSDILNVVFDCSDAEGVARFWSEAMKRPRTYQDMPGNPFWIVGDVHGPNVRLVFVEVPEEKATKNRVHLDLRPVDGSQDDEVARLVSLGASVVDDRRDSEPGGWVVMVDPEDNEFCLEHGS